VDVDIRGTTLLCQEFLGTTASVKEILASESDHDLTTCPNFGKESFLLSSDTCARRKLNRMCAKWVEFMIVELATLDDRWGWHPQTTINFRGSIADAKSTFLDKIDEFYTFGGSDLVIKYAASLKHPKLPYDLHRQYDSFEDFRMNCVNYLDAMPNLAFKESGVCNEAGTAGECIAAWATSATGEKYTGPTHSTTGLWATGPGHAVASFGGNVLGCSRNIDYIQNKEKLLSQLPAAYVVGLFFVSKIKQFAYILGGRINKVDPQETAIGPAMRKGHVVAMGIMDQCDNLTRHFPEGACYNHEGLYHETDFERVAWQDNAARLSTIKQKYDPKHRFNGYKTFGYLPECTEEGGGGNGAVIGGAVGGAVGGLVVLGLAYFLCFKSKPTPQPSPPYTPPAEPVPTSQVEQQLTYGGQV
jgi:hypothetical protein